MLSRVAAALYWMSRYVERAENISRFVEVNWHLTLEQPDNEFQEWRALISVTGDNDLFLKRYANFTKENVVSFLMFDTTYPHSVISCLRSARENARTVRDTVPNEIWEQINTFYHFVEETGRQQTSVCENPYGFCQQIQLKGMLLGGIEHDAMSHGEGWHFCRLGRYLERADKTSRILDVKYFILLPDVRYVGTTFDDVQWAALLRATGGLNAYRHQYRRIFPANATQFLLFDPDFPRSVSHCLTAAQEALHAISGTPRGTFRNIAEQRLGRLRGELAYTDISTVFTTGIHEFTDQLQLRMNRIHDAVAEVFFR